MAVVSRFFDVLIIMLFRKSDVEGPHFQANHAEHNLQVSIDPVRIMAGKMPRRIERTILRWAELRQAELLENWQRCRKGEQPLPIEPWS